MNNRSHIGALVLVPVAGKHRTTLWQECAIVMHKPRYRQIDLGKGDVTLLHQPERNHRPQHSAPHGKGRYPFFPGRCMKI